jgi:hypothetical protein
MNDVYRVPDHSICESPWLLTAMRRCRTLSDRFLRRRARREGIADGRHSAQLDIAIALVVVLLDMSIPVIIVVQMISAVC